MYEIFFIGLLITLIFIAVTGYYPGGIIVPGFLVLFIDQPLRLVGTLVVAILTFLIFRLVQRYLILYGKRRFVFLLMTGAVLTFIMSAALPKFFAGSIEFRVIGWIIPGLIAGHFDRQGIAITSGFMALVTAFLFGLKKGIFWLTVVLGFSSGPIGMYSSESRQAASIMQESIEVISAYCSQWGINQDLMTDPMQTGLIGPEYSAITTTLGQLASKRTTLNPEFASVIATMIEEAGFQRGDTIGIGSSGSFPALMIASLSAAKALDLEVRLILSLGASSYGASDPKFNIMDICQVLISKGIFNQVPIAVSLGGEKDIGQDFDEFTRQMLIRKTESWGGVMIHQPDLSRNIQERIQFLENHHPGSIRLFISTGGSYSNLGTSSGILKLPSGLIRKTKLPDQEEWGMIHAMLDKGTPVVHLLFIKGLAEQWHLTWDPVSLPAVQ